MKKYKYIDNNHGYSNLTFNKTYKGEVDRIFSDHIVIINDDNKRVLYPKNIFKEVECISKKFPIGCEVVCNHSSDRGKVYKVIGYTTNGLDDTLEVSPSIRLPTGLHPTFATLKETKNKMHPRLKKIQNEIDDAQKFVGKKVKFSNRNLVNLFVVKSVDVFFENDPCYSKKELIRQIIKSRGYCVYVTDNVGNAYPVEEIVICKNMVKLNDEYSAEIDGDKVKVGCQTFDIEKIREVLATYDCLKD